MALNLLRTTALLSTCAWAAVGSAQVPPVPAPAAPDDTPSVAVGGVIFANYTYATDPKIRDADGNSIQANAFEVGRAYINVTGRVSHLVSFRVTPDIGTRFGTTVTGGTAGERVSTSFDGSLVFRLKLAYGQLSLEDWLPKGAWVRIGQQQTPYVDGMESIYRYRFQGTVFPEREAFISSADVGLSAHYAFPSDYGNVHVGVYNGDTYSRAEANDQKALQGRVSVRPLPRNPVWKGLRLHAFYDSDHYVKSAARNRFIGTVTFEHKHLNIGVDYLDARDRTSATAPEITARGYDVWFTPRTNIGLEGLFRFDSLKPNDAIDAKKTRTIAGVAYWFKSQKALAAAAILADYEQVSYDALLLRPDEKRFAIHCLFAF